MERWNGSTAVVTGASAGIGAAICLVLANAGLRVVGLARRPHLIEKLQSEVQGKGTIHSRQCDVSKPDDIAAAFKWIDENFGGIHVLVNNAGVLHEGQITDVGNNTVTEEHIISTIDINLKGPIICARHAVASMKRNNIDGHIVTINSIAGHYIPFGSMYNVYPCTKYGITAFMATLGQELASFKNKIKTTSISPGLVDTDMVRKYLELPKLQPREVADAVYYVLSTPPNVNINELTITPVSELRL